MQIGENKYHSYLRGYEDYTCKKLGSGSLDDVFVGSNETAKSNMLDIPSFHEEINTKALAEQVAKTVQIFNESKIKKRH